MLSREHHRRRSPESSRRRRRERRDSRERLQGQPILTSISPHEEPSPEPYQEPFQLQVRQPFPEPYEEPYQEPYQDTHLKPYPREPTPTRDHDHDSDRDVSSPYTNSSSSSTSSSLLNVSRPRRGFGLGLFFSGGDRKHRRRVKKKRSRILGFGNSSSSSVGSDLAYGRGYIDRRRSREFSSPNGRRPRSKDNDPQRPRPAKRAQTDEEIIELGRKIAEFAREQNAEDLRVVGRTRPSTLAGAMSAINQFRRTNSGNVSRGVGSSKPRQDSSSDDSDWESAASSDEESSEDDVDSGLAYGSSHSLPSHTGESPQISAPVSHAHLHPEEIPLNRKRSLVDPKLFGPVNSLRGFVEAPCGFERVDRSRVTTMREQYEQSIAPPESVVSAEDYPLQRVVPVPTSDPSRFDVDRGSTVSVRQDVMPRSRPEPVPIQQPKPIAPVHRKVLESVESDPDFGSSRTTPKTGHQDTAVGLASGAGGTSLSSDAAIGALLKSALMARKKKLEGTPYEDTPWQLNSNGKGRQGEHEGTDDITRDIHSEAIPALEFEPEVIQGGSSEKRRSKKRESDLDPVYGSATSGRDAYQMVLSDILAHKRRGGDSRDDQKVDERLPLVEERQEVAIFPRAPKHDVSTGSGGPLIEKSNHPMDPFQYQVADDAFSTPRYPTPAQPVIMTIEREPDFSKFDPTEPLEPLERLSRKDSFERELREALKARATGQRIKAPSRRADVAAEAKSEHAEYSREQSPKRHTDSQDPSRCSSSTSRNKDPVLDDADRAYREARRARRIVEEEERSRSNSPDSSILDKWKDDKGPVSVQIVPSPVVDNPKEKNPYDKPNADVRIDNVLEHPKELSRFRISESRHRSSAVPTFSARDPSAERDRPVLNLVRPTPAPSPSSEKRRFDKSMEVLSQSVTNSDAAPNAVQDEAVSPPSSPPSKTMDLVQSQTPHYAIESHEQEHDEHSDTKATVSATTTISQMENKADLDAVAATISGVGIGVATASLADTTSNPGAVHETVKSRDPSRGFQRPSSFSFDVYDDPPTPGPKPGSSRGSRLSGRFAEDPVFMANIAAGLEGSGFDPDIIIEDADFHRRESPPGSDEALISSTTTDSSRDTERRRGALDYSVDVPQTAAMDDSDSPPDHSKRHSRLNKKQRRRQKHASHRDVHDTPTTISHHVLPEASHSASERVAMSPIVDPIDESQIRPDRAITTATEDYRIRNDSFALEEPELNTDDQVDTIQNTMELKKLEPTATTEEIPCRELQHSGQYADTDEPSKVVRSASISESKDVETVLSEWEQSIYDSDENAESIPADATQIVSPLAVPLQEQNTISMKDTTQEEEKARRAYVADEQPKLTTRDSRLSSENQLPAIESEPYLKKTEEVGPIAESKNALWDAPDPEPVAEFVGVPQTAEEDLNRKASDEPLAATSRDGVVESDESPPDRHKFSDDVAPFRHSIDGTTEGTRDIGSPSNLRSEGPPVSDEEWKDLPWRLKKKKNWHKGHSATDEEPQHFDVPYQFPQSSEAFIERPNETSTRLSGTNAPPTEVPTDTHGKEGNTEASARSTPGGFPEDKDSPRDSEPSAVNRAWPDLGGKKGDGGLDFFNRLKSSIGLAEEKDLPPKHNDDKGPFLDNAGTRGASAGLIGAAIALVTNKDHPEPADTARSIGSPRGEGIDGQPASSPLPEFIDPEIVQREIRPAIDPTYGDLLPLPPSRPSTPVLDLDENFPPLPESRPGTPESDRERRLWTQQSPHVRRRSDTPLRVKTPSNSAIPIQFRLGQRTAPVSPNLVRASPGSPVATASETSSVSRPRSRPMSWENTKTFKPLLLVEKTCRESTGTPTALHEESQASDMVRDPLNEFDRMAIQASEARDHMREDRSSQGSTAHLSASWRYSQLPQFPAPGSIHESGNLATASDLFDPVSKNRSSYLYYSSPSSAEKTQDGDMSDSSPTLMAAGRRAALSKLTQGMNTDDSLGKDATTVEPDVLAHRDNVDDHSDVEELPASIRDDFASSVLPLPKSLESPQMIDTNESAMVASEINESSSPQKSELGKNEPEEMGRLEETTSVIIPSDSGDCLTADVLDPAVEVNAKPNETSLPIPSEQNITQKNKEESQEIPSESEIVHEATVPAQVLRNDIPPATTELDCDVARTGEPHVDPYPVAEIGPSPKTPVDIAEDGYYAPDRAPLEVSYEDFHEVALDIPVDTSAESSVEPEFVTPFETPIQAPLESLTEQSVAAPVEKAAEVLVHASVANSNEGDVGSPVEGPVDALSHPLIESLHDTPNDKSGEAADSATAEQSLGASVAPIGAPLETSVNEPINSPIEVSVQAPVETLGETLVETPTSTVVESLITAPSGVAADPPYDTFIEPVTEVLAEPLAAPVTFEEEPNSTANGSKEESRQSQAHEPETRDQPLTIQEPASLQDGEAHDEAKGESPIQNQVEMTVTPEMSSTVSDLPEIGPENDEKERSGSSIHSQRDFFSATSLGLQEQVQAISGSETIPVDVTSEPGYDTQHTQTPHTAIDIAHSEFEDDTLGDEAKNSIDESEQETASTMTLKEKEEKTPSISKLEREASVVVDANAVNDTVACNQESEPHTATLPEDSDPITEDLHTAVDENPSSVNTYPGDYHFDLLPDEPVGGLEQPSDISQSLVNITDPTISDGKSGPDSKTIDRQESEERLANQADERSATPLETRIVGVSQSSAPSNEGALLTKRGTFSEDTQQETEPIGFTEDLPAEPVLEDPPVASTEHFKPAEPLNSQLDTVPNAQISAAGDLTSTEANTTRPVSAETWTKKKSKKGKNKRQSTSSLPDLDYLITTSPMVESIREPQIKDAPIIDQPTDIAPAANDKADDFSQETLTTDGTPTRSTGSSDKSSTNHTDKESARENSVNVEEEVEALPEPEETAKKDTIDTINPNSSEVTFSDPGPEKMLSDSSKSPQKENEEATEDERSAPIEEAAKPWWELDQIATLDPVDVKQEERDIGLANADQASSPVVSDAPEAEAEGEIVAEAPSKMDDGDQISAPLDTVSNGNLSPTRNISDILRYSPELLGRTMPTDNATDMRQSPGCPNDGLQSLVISQEKTLESSKMVAGEDTSGISHPVAEGDSDVRHVPDVLGEPVKEPSVDVDAASTSAAKLKSAGKHSSVEVTEPIDESLETSGEGSDKVAAPELPTEAFDDLAEPPEAPAMLVTPTGRHSNGTQDPELEREDRMVSSPSPLDLDPASIPLPDDEFDVDLDANHEDRTIISSPVDINPASIPLPNDALDTDVDLDQADRIIVSSPIDLDPAPVSLPDDEVNKDFDTKQEDHIILPSLINIDPASVPLPDDEADTEFYTEQEDRVIVSSPTDIDPASIPLPDDTFDTDLHTAPEDRVVVSSPVDLDPAFIPLPDDVFDTGAETEHEDHIILSRPGDLHVASIPLPDEEANPEFCMEQEDRMIVSWPVDLDPASIPLPDEEFDTDLVEQIPPYPASPSVQLEDDPIYALHSCEVIRDLEKDTATRSGNDAESSPLVLHEDETGFEQETESRDMNIGSGVTLHTSTKPDHSAPLDQQVGETMWATEHATPGIIETEAEPTQTRETTFDDSVSTADTNALPPLEGNRQAVSPLLNEPEAQKDESDELGQRSLVNPIPSNDGVPGSEIEEEIERGDKASSESKLQLSDESPQPGGDGEIKSDESEPHEPMVGQREEIPEQLVTSDITDYTANEQVSPLERSLIDLRPATQHEGQQRLKKEVDDTAVPQLEHHTIHFPEPIAIPATEGQIGPPITIPQSPSVTQPIEGQSSESIIHQDKDGEKIDTQAVDQIETGDEASVVATSNFQTSTSIEPTRVHSLPEPSDDQSILTGHAEEHTQTAAADTAELGSTIPTTPIHREASFNSSIPSDLDPAPLVIGDGNTPNNLELVPTEDSEKTEERQPSPLSDALTVLEESRHIQEDVSPAEASQASDLKVSALNEGAQQADGGDPFSPKKSKKSKKKKKRASLASLLDAEASPRVPMNTAETAQTYVYETEQRDATPQTEPASILADREPENHDDSKVGEPTIVDAVPNISPAEQANDGEDDLGPQGANIVAESPTHVSASLDKQEQSVLEGTGVTSIKEAPCTGEVQQASTSVPGMEHQEPRKRDETISLEDRMDLEVEDSAAPELADIGQPDSVVNVFEEVSADQDAIISHAREMETTQDQPTKDHIAPMDNSVPEYGDGLGIKDIARDDDVSRATFPSEHLTHGEIIQDEPGPDSGALQNEDSVLDSAPVEHKGSADVMESQSNLMSTTQPTDEAPAVARKSKKSKKKRRSSLADNQLIHDPSGAIAADTIVDLTESTKKHISRLDLTNDSNDADSTPAASENVENGKPSSITHVSFDDATKDYPSILEQTGVAEDSVPATTAHLDDISLPNTSPAEEYRNNEDEITTSHDNEVPAQWSSADPLAVTGRDEVDFPTNELSMSEPPGNDDPAQPTSPSNKKKDKKKRKKKKKQAEELKDGAQQEVLPEAEPSKQALSQEAPAHQDSVQEQSVVEESIREHAQKHTTGDITEDQPTQEDQVQEDLIQDRPLSEPLPDQPVQQESGQCEPTPQTRHRRHTSAGSLLEKTVTGAILREYVQRQSVVDEPIQESTAADNFDKEECVVEDHVEEGSRPEFIQEEHTLSDLEPVQTLTEESSVVTEPTGIGATQEPATGRFAENVSSLKLSIQESGLEQPAEKSSVREPRPSLAGDAENPYRPEEMLKEPTLDDPAQLTRSQTEQAETLQSASSLESEELANNESTKSDSPGTSATKKSNRDKKTQQGNSRDIETAPLGEPPLDERQPVTTTEPGPLVGLPLEHEAVKVTIPDDAMGYATKVASSKEERDGRSPLNPQEPIATVTDTTPALAPSTDDQADRDVLLPHGSIKAKAVESSMKETAEPEGSPLEDDNEPQLELGYKSIALPDVSTVALEGDGLVNSTLVDKTEDMTKNSPDITGETFTDIVKPGDAIAGDFNPSQDAMASLLVDLPGSTGALGQNSTKDVIAVSKPDQSRPSNIDHRLEEAPSKVSQETMHELSSVAHQATPLTMEEARQHDKVEESNPGSSRQSLPPSQELGTELPKETPDKGIERADTVWKKKSKKDKKKKKRASQVSWEEPKARIEDLPQQQQPAQVFDEQPMTSEPNEMDYNNEAAENLFPKLAPDNESTSKNLRQSQVDWEPEPNIENAVKTPKPLLPTQQDQGNDMLLDPQSLAEDTETSLKDSINLDDNSLEIISSYKPKTENEANRPKWNLEPPITEPAAGFLPAEQQVSGDHIDPTEAPTNESVKVDSEAAAVTEDVTPTIVSPEHIPTGLIDPSVNMEHPAKNDLNTGAHNTRSVEYQAYDNPRTIDNASHGKDVYKQQSHETQNEPAKLSIPQVWDVQQSILDEYGQLKPTMILQPSDSWRKASPRPEEPNRQEPLWDEFEYYQDKKNATPSEPNSGAGLQTSQPHNANVKSRYAIHPDLGIEEAKAKKSDKQPAVIIPSQENSRDPAIRNTGSEHHSSARSPINAPKESSADAFKPRPRTPSPNRASFLVDMPRAVDPSTPPNKELGNHSVDDNLLPENVPTIDRTYSVHPSGTLGSQTSSAQQNQKTTSEDSSTIRPDETKRESEHKTMVETGQREVKLSTEAPEDTRGLGDMNAEDSATVAANRSAKDDDFWVSPSARMAERLDDTTRRINGPVPSPQLPPSAYHDSGTNEASTDSPPEAIRTIFKPSMPVGVSPIGTRIKAAATTKQQPNQDDTHTPGQLERHDNPLQSDAQYTLGGPFVPSLPPPRTPSASDYNQSLAPVKEESHEDLEKASQSSPTRNAQSTPEADRDSGFVLDSPTPQRGSLSLEDSGQRDSGVHLRDSIESTIPMPDDEAALTPIDEGASSQAPRPRARRLRRALFDKETSQSSTSTETTRGLSLDSGGALGKPLEGEAQINKLQRSMTDNISDANQETLPPSDTTARRSFSIASISRMRTPESRPETPASHGIRSIHSMRSLRSSGTNTPPPPLRRMNRRMISGDLRAVSHTSPPNPSLSLSTSVSTKDKEKDPTRHSTGVSTNISTSESIQDTARDVPPLDRHAQQPTTITPIANEGRVRAKDIPDVYDGYGEGRIGSPRSPTRPPSMRRRQSMQVLELESRVEQLLAENRALADARARAEQNLNQRNTSAISDRDAEIEQLKASLQWLRNEVTRLTEVNEGLQSANSVLALQHNEKFTRLESQNASVAREIEESRGVRDQYTQLLEAKDAEIQELRNQLEAAKEQIRAMKKQILDTTPPDADFLRLKDEDHFDNRCQQLCSHVQQWVLRFSKFSDMRACRLTSEINDEKIIDRLDNTILDGSDVDDYLRDRVARRDIFMSMTMNMIWEFIFTRYLFGMDREQRQKLKSLEKNLTEVGPTHAVRQWRAITLTLLSRRRGFAEQCSQDREAVVQAILHTLSMILPPPSNLESQIQYQLRRVMREAVDLAIEMRTQRAEYMMLPPLQPEYDANGELTQTVAFNAALMHERSGDSSATNEEYEAKGAIVRCVLFPLVVKKGNDNGFGDDEIVVSPAQVLIAKPRRSTIRMVTPSSDVGGMSLISDSSPSAYEKSHVSVNMQDTPLTPEYV